MSQWLRKKQKLFCPEPEKNRIACYKCGQSFVNGNILNGHINRCRGTGVTMQSNTLTFTQSEIQRAASAKDGPYSLQNNTYVGEAYQQQLQMPPSLAELARLHRTEQERTDDGERGEIADDGEHSCNSVQFDPMIDVESRDDDLPIKYVNKMNRYTEMKNKVPNNKPKLADAINYTKQWEANPPLMLNYSRYVRSTEQTSPCMMRSQNGPNTIIPKTLMSSV
jgi:hypothetical protein